MTACGRGTSNRLELVLRHVHPSELVASGVQTGDNRSRAWASTCLARGYGLFAEVVASLQSHGTVGDVGVDGRLSILRAHIVLASRSLSMISVSSVIATGELPNCLGL